ncbi:Condensation domain-containing protein [Chitinophaga sp. CF118]|uniref:condensation domain-containing protein n=1 Tax=Chitinophaga sp. CF118 TaxID=1884367 RepID=UPI0008EA3E86|nr:condensation domain-containing protein [Chitinophaga sp. CF118]SFD00826.1 Condensation domain-containing protein [Chitinophaga sp. CF118]
MINTESEVFSLTCGQRYLVYRIEANPDSGKPLQRVYRLNKDFNYMAFCKAFHHIVASHPALRLQLLNVKGEWKQYFPDQKINVPQIKVRGIFRLFSSIYTELLISDEIKKAFDLRSESPIKAKIFKANGQNILSLCVDHLAVDGISFNLLERTLLNTYQQVLNGFSLSDTPSESFFKYLYKEVEQEKFERDNLLYWQQHLKGSLLKMNYHVENLYVPANTFKCHLIGPSFATFINFCQTNNCSIFTVLIAIQLLMLSDIGKLDDIILSIPVSNRASAEEESIIGNLFMPLYVSFPIISDEPILQFLFRIRVCILNALLHKQYDFPSLAQFINNESRKMRRKIIFNKECNLITDDNPMVYPNVLFAERLDNNLNKSLKIPKSSFNIDAVRTESVLDIDIIWDHTTWPITNSDMESKFGSTLQTIYAM